MRDAPSRPEGGTYLSPPLGTLDVADPATPGGVLTRRAADTAFTVHLDVFEGPFELLLGLITKHKLDITEVALAQVTDEFIAHIRAQQTAETEWDLGQASEFLLVAATLLDLKAARLLPQSGPQDEEDLALIEARDLLFARLLQYRAFKDIAATFADRMSRAGRGTARQAGLEPEFAGLLPELVIGRDSGAARPDRGPGHGAQTGPDGRARPPPRSRRQRPGAGGAPRLPAPARADPLLPLPRERRREHPGHRRAVPRRPRALPGRLGRRSTRPRRWVS